jgi:hypothetical protein
VGVTSAKQQEKQRSDAGLEWWAQGKHIGPFGGSAKRSKRGQFSDMNELKTPKNA